MAIFNSYVSLPEGNLSPGNQEKEAPILLVSPSFSRSFFAGIGW
jgi:hypothetical protein